MVPAVNDVWRWHDAQYICPRAVSHAVAPPHAGQRNPSGHRSRWRYSAQPASEPNQSSNSRSVRG